MSEGEDISDRGYQKRGKNRSDEMDREYRRLLILLQLSGHTFFIYSRTRLVRTKRLSDLPLHFWRSMIQRIIIFHLIIVENTFRNQMYQMRLPNRKSVQFQRILYFSE